MMQVVVTTGAKKTQYTLATKSTKKPLDFGGNPD